MDGVDAAMFRIIPVRRTGGGNGAATTLRLEIEMQDSLLHGFEPAFKRKMQSLVAGGTVSLEELARLNAALGEVFAQATLALLRRTGLTRREVDLIGSHGQTIWHAPAIKSFAGIQTRSTLQLGEPAIIAQRTGIPVVADFRVQDMAAGGQGAPLVAFADEVIFGGTGKPVGVLNIGGIANITVLDERGDAIMAFDTGPGNMLIDHAMSKLFNEEFDEGGAIGDSVQPDEKWLDELSGHAYFQQQPPKTTGRELFGAQLANKLIDEGRKRGLSSQQIVSTFTSLTARSIAEAYERFVLPTVKLEMVVLGGGGADNDTLCKRLRQSWSHKVDWKRHEDFGMSTKYKEALLFALLAYTTHFGIPNNVPQCTGAGGRVCLGKIVRP
jgi:anhydro-N-acetylmuramic acid kinase